MSEEATAPPSVSKESAIDAIRFEIESAEKDRERPGWNAWALLLSVAAIAWLLIAEVEKATIGRGSARWVVASVLAWDALVMGWSLVQLIGPPIARPGRYQLVHRFLLRDAEGLAVTVLRFFGLVALLVATMPTRSFAFWVPVTYIGILCILIAFAVAASALGVPTSMTPGACQPF